MKVNIIIRCHCHCRFDFLFLVCIFVSSRLCVLVSWCLVVMFSILSANASIHLSLISSRKLVCVWCVKYFVWFFVLLLCVAVAVALLSAPFPTSEQSLPFPSLSSCHHLVSHSLAALLRFVCCLVNYVFIPSTSHPIPSRFCCCCCCFFCALLCSLPLLRLVV
jgi:hypothetical protein